jgi:hypothetical protein
MQVNNSQGFEKPEAQSFSLVYCYLMAGIALLIAVFLFLPRVSIG